MSVGTGTAIALAIGAGASVASSAIQAKSAGNAVKSQTDSAQQALALQAQQYAQQQQRQQPYQQLGAMALGRLGAMPENTAQFNPNQYSGGAPIQPPAMTQPSMNQNRFQPPGAPMAGQGMEGQTMGGGMPQQGAEQMVTLEAPDGTRRQFPQSQAQMYLARGAKVVQ